MPFIVLCRAAPHSAYAQLRFREGGFRAVLGGGFRFYFVAQDPVVKAVGTVDRWALGGVVLYRDTLVFFGCEVVGRVDLEARVDGRSRWSRVGAVGLRSTRVFVQFRERLQDETRICLVCRSHVFGPYGDVLVFPHSYAEAGRLVGGLSVFLDRL